ncbi:uncharacterized protein DS421_14g459100 [Arachis hypogaea]|nr:uncharacterized protein DS421_14g459100 [Arachis hypogaea]
MEHNSVEPSCLVPVSFTGDSFNGESEQLDKDNRVESAANQASEASAQQITKQGLGGFMSLLNSFDNT